MRSTNFIAFKTFKPFKSIKPPPLFLPRDAREDVRRGLNGSSRLRDRLNGLNDLDA